MAITRRTIKRTNAAGETVERVVWRSRIPDPSKPASASVKIEATFATKREAQEHETRQKAAIATGTYVSARAGATTLAEVADAWRETWDAKPLSPKTQQGYDSILEHHVLPRWGEVKVSAIDAKGVQAWIGTLARQRHAETVHHAYTALRQCLKVAVAHRLIAANPCTPDSITLPSKKAANATREQLYLTAGELRELVGAMPDHWRTATLVAGLCGLRAGELWGLRRGDVDLLHERITVTYALKDIRGELIAGGTKSHARRSLSIPAPLIEPLRSLLDEAGVRVRAVARGKARPSGYPAILDGELGWTDDAQHPGRLLFTTVAGSAVNHSNFAARVFEPTRNGLWPEGHRLHALRWHDLRHTAASLAIAATGNLGIVQKRLGHSSITLTYDRYGHMLPEADKSLADALGAMFDATEPPSNVIPLHGESS